MMILDQRSDESVYVKIGKWVIYLDKSTNEKIIDHWEEGDNEKSKDNNNL